MLQERVQGMWSGVVSAFRVLFRDSKGSILLETVVASIIFAMVGTAVLAGLSTMYASGSLTETQSVAENLSRNQMEFVFNQPYREPQQTSYQTISGVPANYSVTTTVEYASISSPNPEVEQIAVTTSYLGQNTLTLESIRGRADGLRLAYSASSNRTNSQRLAGGDIGGTVYVFLDDPELLIDGQVEFLMDGFGPLVTDNFAQWDFKGTTGIDPTDLANPWDTSIDPFASNGTHKITARALLKDGNTVNITADFTITN